MGVGARGARGERSRCDEAAPCRCAPSESPPPHSGQLTSRPGGQLGFMSWTYSGMHRLPPRRVSARCRGCPHPLPTQRRPRPRRRRRGHLFARKREDGRSPVGRSEHGHLRPQLACSSAWVVVYFRGSGPVFIQGEPSWRTPAFTEEKRSETRRFQKPAVSGLPGRLVPGKAWLIGEVSTRPLGRGRSSPACGTSEAAGAPAGRSLSGRSRQVNPPGGRGRQARIKPPLAHTAARTTARGCHTWPAASHDRERGVKICGGGGSGGPRHCSSAACSWDAGGMGNAGLKTSAEPTGTAPGRV